MIPKIKSLFASTLYSSCEGLGDGEFVVKSHHKESWPHESEAKANDLSSILAPTWWEEKVNSGKLLLSSTLIPWHMHVHVYMHACAHTHTNKKMLKNQIIKNNHLC